MELRPYQHNGVDRLRASYRAGKRAPLYVLPTGGGKTHTFSDMTLKSVMRNNKVLIMVHRQELLKQASNSLKMFNINHGIIRPGFTGERENVAVASIQTLDRRLKQMKVEFDFVIIDEAHHAGAKTWNRVLSQFPKSHLLGVTATPIRLDGRGLGVNCGGIFDDLICGPSISELIEQGYLVPPVVYAYQNDIDLTGVKRKSGDFNARQLAGRVDKSKITGSAVEHYTRLAAGEPAIGFCASLDHAAHVTDDFRKAGYVSEVIHGGLHDEERAEMIAAHAAGRIHVLNSVDLISEGTDIPICSVAILLRPTASMGLYLQQCGRILRPAPGKTRGLVLDHVGNCLRHGLPDDDREWTLDGMRRSEKSSDDDALMLRQCKKCFAVWEKAIKCPYCGNINTVQARTPEQVEGELKRIFKEEEARKKSEQNSDFAQAQSLQEMKELCVKYKLSPGYAHHRWQARVEKERARAKLQRRL